MIYVTSDLHGYPLNEFKVLLSNAGFSDDDFLFILGDVIDRGEHGAELLHWISEQSNVELILGNHEAMLLACDFLFDTVTDESISKLDMHKMSLLNTWMQNGAEPTLRGLRKFLKEDPYVFDGIIDLLKDAPLYDIIAVNGKNYVLVHSGFENFDIRRPLSSYSADEVLFARPTLKTAYFKNATVIFGHTPTECFSEEYRGKSVHTDSWICIDTGAASGNKPMLLRLDDMKEFY